jgi:hypothetical protein
MSSPRENSFGSFTCRGHRAGHVICGNCFVSCSEVIPDQLSERGESMHRSSSAEAMRLVSALKISKAIACDQHRAAVAHTSVH